MKVSGSFKEWNDIEEGGCVHAIVVFILPTFARSDIFASSVANAGVSRILSFSTFEHFAEKLRALMYSSLKVILFDDCPGV